MNLMFWKKKTTPDDSEVDSQEKPGDKTVSRKLLGDEPRRQETSEDAHGETVDVGPAHPRRRLVIGAAIGVLVLAAIGMTTWKIFLPSPNQNTATADTPTSIQPNPLAEKKLKLSGPFEFLQLRKAQSKDHQADIEALKKKNGELPQIGMLEIEPSQVENLQSASGQAEIEILRKRNDELQAQIEALKIERSQVENPQSASRQAEILILKKKNDELQTQNRGTQEKTAATSFCFASRSGGGRGSATHPQWRHSNRQRKSQSHRPDLEGSY
jgi:hypothetical protein